MSAVRPWFTVLTFAGIYAGAAELAHTTSIEPGHVATLWLPSGVFLAALLLSAPAKWRVLIGAAVAANVVSDVGIHGHSFPVALAFAIANSVEAVAAAWVLRTWCGSQFEVSSLHGITALVVVSAGSSALGASMGATTAAFTFGSSLLTSWPLWWSGDLLGVLLIVPPALALSDPATWRVLRNLRWPQFIEGALLAGGVLAVGQTVFGSGLTGFQAFPGAVFPFFLWAALRGGPPLVSALLLLGSVVVITNTAQGLGPFAIAALSPPQRVLTSQLFLGVGGVSFLVLACLTADRRRALDALRASEQRLHLALSSSRLALWDWDVRSRRVYLSEKWSEMIGSGGGPAEILLDDLVDLVHPDDRTRVEAHLKEVLRGSEPAYDIEHRVRSPRGVYTWIHSKGRVIERDSRGRALRLAGTNDNVTYRKEAEEELYRRATRDPLTGLWNRSVFLDRLHQAASRCERSSVGIALCYLDVDNFKLINDRFGHAVGDELLRQFSTRLSRFVRRSDTFARVGGDEFAVLLESVWKPEDLRVVCENLLLELRPAFKLGEQTVLVTTSIGAAWCAGRSGLSAALLLEQADSAMYEAKRHGRNRFSIVAAA